MLLDLLMTSDMLPAPPIDENVLVALPAPVYPSVLPWSSRTVNAPWIPMSANMSSDKRFLPWTPPDDLSDSYMPIVYSDSHYFL